MHRVEFTRGPCLLAEYLVGSGGVERERNSFSVGGQLIGRYRKCLITQILRLFYFFMTPLLIGPVQT